MKSSLFEFRVEVPEAGYEWKSSSAEVPAGKELFIECAQVLVPRESSRDRIYRPLIDTPGLFRSFADLDPADRHAIQQFADGYGALGLEGRKYRGLEPEPPWNGECYGFWYEEISAMKVAVQICDWVCSRCKNKLSELVHWEANGVVVTPDFGDAVRFSDTEWPQLFRSFRPHDVIKPAQSYLQHAINHKLTEHDVVPKLLWDLSIGQLSWRVVPNALIGALWAQLGQSISANNRFQQCAACTTWFEITAERRADAKFCSPACRSRAYRMRKRTGGSS